MVRYSQYHHCATCTSIHSCQRNQYLDETMNCLPSGIALNPENGIPAACKDVEPEPPTFGYCPNQDPDCRGICGGVNHNCPRSFGFVTAPSKFYTYNAGSGDNAVKNMPERMHCV